MYEKISIASFASTIVAGSTCGSATMSFPLTGGFPNIMPIPPASKTTAPFSTRAEIPRKHATIFPATFVGSSVPLKHKRLQNVSKTHST